MRSLASQSGRVLDILAGNLIRLHDLHKALRALNAEGIHPVALKGFGLLQTHYRDALHRRPMADVDLLLEPQLTERAGKLLMALGYQENSSGTPSYALCRKSSYTKIDLHSGVWYLSPTEVKDFVSRCVYVELQGMPLRVPAPEDHLIYIAVHAVILHGHLRDMWLEDLHRLMSGEPDWSAIVRRACRAGLHTPLRLALERCAAVKGSQVPDAVLEKLVPAAGEGWRTQILETALEQPETPDIGHLLRFLFLKGSRAKAQALARQLFPSEEFLSRRYGLGSRPVFRHSLLRPLRTFGRSVRLLYRLANGGAALSGREAP